MDNLNNIPNAGNWGNAASKLNDNFNKIKQAVTTVENTSKNNKGYFTSLSALNTAFPSPKAGLTAYVYGEASSTNYYIYNAVNGAWVASSVEAPSVGVDIAGYTKTGGSTKTTKDIDDIKANHGYDSNPKTLKEVDDDLVQLESDLSVKIRNLITNGDFVNDVNGWSGSGISVEHDSGRLRAYGWLSSANRIISTAMGGLSIGDLLYLRIGEYERSVIPEDNLIRARITDRDPYIIDEANNPNLIIKDLSGIAPYNGETPRIHIRTFQGEDNSVWIDDVVCINLTEAFGAGNEPSKEEMDLLISTLGIDYFEGEITIPAQKVMQWLLGSQQQSEDKIDEKANHGYASFEEAKTLKQVDDDLVQLAGDVSQITKSQAIQILKQQDSSLIFQGFTKPADDTPAAILNHAYYVIESGDVFGVAASEGDVLVGDGEGFGVLNLSPVKDIQVSLDDMKTNRRYYDDLSELSHGLLVGPSDTYSKSDYIEIGEYDVIRFSLHGSAWRYIEYYNANQETIGSDSQSPNGWVNGLKTPPVGTQFIRFCTRNENHPSFEQGFYVEIYESTELALNQITTNINQINTDVTDFITYGKKVINEDALLIGSLPLSNNSKYRATPYLNLRNVEFVEYRVCVYGTADYFEIYDADRNVIFSIRGPSIASGPQILEGKIAIPTNGDTFRIHTMSESHEEYIPYEFKLEMIYRDGVDPGITSIIPIVSQEAFAPNISVKAFKELNYTDGSFPKSGVVLWNDTLSDDFYLSTDVKGERYKIFGWDLSLSNDFSSGYYSAVILPNGDILFVFRTEFAGTVDPPSDDTRRNPILYVAANNYEPVEIDFGELLKPSGWLQNVGVHFSYRYNRLFIAEYTRDNVPKARVWTVDMPVTDVSNWNVVLEKDIPVPYASGFKHFHTVQGDPFNPVLYASSGDLPSTSYLWYSIDGGSTFEQIDEPNHAKYRMLNMVFTKDNVWWASDDWRESHRFWKATRNENGVIDPLLLEEILVFPFEVTSEDYNRIATYSSVYLECYNAILFLDRDDSGFTTYIPLRIYDINTGTLHDVGKIYSLTGSGSYGFRNEAVTIYPKENQVVVSFGQRYNNRIKMLGNGVGGQINNLILNVFKDGDGYRVTFDTVY